MTFADVRFLVAAGVIVLVLAVAHALDFTRRRRLMEKIGHAPQLARMAESVSPGRRIAKAVLTVLGATLLALALARPQVKGETIWRQRGIDVTLVLDFSKSMMVADVYPSRIERAKIEGDELLAKFAGDRVALVPFGGAAIHFPLTADYEAVKLVYHGLDPRDMAPGSDIGEAIVTARCVLLPGLKGDAQCARVRGGAGGDQRRAPRGGPVRELEDTDLGDRGRAIVVFTDGEDTEGGARAAVERAAELGIQVYLVAVATSAGGQIPEYDEEGRLTGWKEEARGVPHVSRLEEGALKELARAAGGDDHYFRIDARRFGVDGLIQTLSKLKEGNLDERTVSVPSEAYQGLLFPGFLVLVIEACLSDRRRRRLAARVRA